jgi:hypothetical protein
MRGRKEEGGLETDKEITWREEGRGRTETDKGDDWEKGGKWRTGG